MTRLRIPDFSGEIQASERALQTASIAAKLPDAERALSAVGVNSSLFSWVLREAVTILCGTHRPVSVRYG